MSGLVPILFIALIVAVVVNRVLSVGIPSQIELDLGIRNASKHSTLVEYWRRRYADSEKNAEADRQKLLKLADFIIKIFPVSRSLIDLETQQLTNSGIRMPGNVLWAMRFVSALVCGILAAYLVYQNSLNLVVGILIVLAVAAIGIQIPTLYVLSFRKKWRERLDAQLPSALDLMLVMVSAGSTLEAAIAGVSERQEGELADALKDVALESRYGSLITSLNNFAQRSGVSSLQIFTATIRQGLATGSSLVDILQMQADSLRAKRRIQLEEKVNKLQVKMLFPMLLFCFPIIMVIILAPVIVELISALGTAF